MSNREEEKEAFKEAIKEWANEQYASAMKWTLRTLATFLFAWFITFLVTHGVFK
jgi:hypothetical protein